MPLVQSDIDGSLVTLTLHDPQRRNALGSAMFDELEQTITAFTKSDDARVVVLRGAGASFCAGFDLPAAIADPPLLSAFIMRLSALNRALRRAPQIVIAAVHGSALAGGCAILSACDFVVASPDATLGYPVHRIGLSPAVTIPTLSQAIGAGTARVLLMGGELIDGREAHHMGLVTHLAASSESVHREAEDLARALLAKPGHAQRITKAWLNELDGSLDDQRFDAPATATAADVVKAETVNMLRAFWASRSG